MRERSKDRSLRTGDNQKEARVESKEDDGLAGIEALATTTATR